MNCIELIEDYRTNRKKYLPMINRIEQIVPKRNEYGDVNIGWNAGLIGENRPYYAECWATEGLTMLTIYVSTSGIEDFTDEQAEKLVIESGYYTPRENYHKASVIRFTDGNKNEFFSINVAVGVEDDVYIDGGNIFSFSILNRYNQAIKNNAENVTAVSADEENISVRKGPDTFKSNIHCRIVGKQIPGSAKIDKTDAPEITDNAENIIPYCISFSFCNIELIAQVDFSCRSVYGDYMIYGENRNPEYDPEKLTDYFFTALYDCLEENDGLSHPVELEIPDSRVFLRDGKIEKRINFENLTLVNYRSEDIDVIIRASYDCGKLEFWGHEIGSVVEEFFHKDEYEYFYSFDSENSEKLFEAIGAEPGQEAEAFLKLFNDVNSTAPLDSILRENDIQHKFFCI